MTDFDLRCFHDLFRVTDPLREMRLNPGSLNLEQYKKLMTELCEALKEAFDCGLESAISYAGSLANDPAAVAEAEAIIKDFDNFVRFVNIQHNILSDCGATKETITDIMIHTAVLREQFGMTRYDTGRVLESAINFREDTCSVARDVTEYFVDEKQRFEDKKRTLRAYGTGLIIAGFGIGVGTWGGGAPLAFAVSGMGSLLMVWEGKLDDPTQRPLGGAP